MLRRCEFDETPIGKCSRRGRPTPIAFGRRLYHPTRSTSEAFQPARLTTGRFASNKAPRVVLRPAPLAAGRLLFGADQILASTYCLSVRRRLPGHGWTAGTSCGLCRRLRSCGSVGRNEPAIVGLEPSVSFQPWMLQTAGWAPGLSQYVRKLTEPARVRLYPGGNFVPGVRASDHENAQFAPPRPDDLKAQFLEQQQELGESHFGFNLTPSRPRQPVLNSQRRPRSKLLRGLSLEPDAGERGA